MLVKFDEELLATNPDQWRSMVEHPFLQEISDGTLAEETFHTWLRQDYLFVESALDFVAVLKGKGPRSYHEFFTDAEVALHEELNLFRERAGELGVSVDDVQPTLTTLSYVQHLRATAHAEPFPVALTAYWTAEKAYHESWRPVRDRMEPDHPWYPFVENWGGDEFRSFVEALTERLNETASQVAPSRLDEMIRTYRRTVRYEIAFWDMAYGQPGDEWLREEAPREEPT